MSDTNKNTAVCTKFMEMKFDGQVLEEPYPCKPKEQEKSCELYFEGDDVDSDGNPMKDET